MNPQFCRTASDRNSVRNEYIKNLQLETSNNLMNYNANQVFKQTGVLPPSVTALLDTRSVTEKYADSQKARVAILSGLREITDGANANQIVSQIQSRDMITLLNNLPQIITEIKPKWSLGITAPAFLSYWDNYKKAFAMNNGVSAYPIIQSNQLLTNIQGVLQNIQATLPTQEELQQLKDIFKLLPKTTKAQMANRAIEEAIEQADEIVKLATRISQMTQEEDPIILEQKIRQVQTAIENSPSKSAIVELTQQAQIVNQLGNSPQEADKLADKVSSELSLMNPSLMTQPSSTPQASTPQSSTHSQQSTPQSSSRASTPQSSSRGSTPESSPMTTAPTETTYEQTGRNPKETGKRQFFEGIPQTYEQWENYGDWGKRRNFINEIYRNNTEFKKAVVWGKDYTGQKSIKSLAENEFAPKTTGDIKKGDKSGSWIGLTNIPELLQEYFKQKPRGGAQESKSSGTEPLEPTPEELKQAGKETGTGIKKKHRIQGRGVNSHRTHAPTTNLTSGGNYYQKPKIDTSHKVEKVPSYIEFGKHVLHQHNLQGGILQIRRRSGTIINDLPRQAVGGKLKKVLITLTGTGSPSFEDINELTDSEKNLLNKVVKTCKIDQRLLVPTPNKSKEEQDFNRLQILSGEITAGNNNPQIVKELKTILLRLKNVGRIPKKQAHEIMEDLLSLGY